MTHGKLKAIKGRIKKIVDFVDPSGNATDECGHGTHCVGLVNKIAPAADLYIGRVAKDFDSGLNTDIVATVSFPRYFVFQSHMYQVSMYM